MAPPIVDEAHAVGITASGAAAYRSGRLLSNACP
jgi:hypothetical protein